MMTFACKAFAPRVRRHIPAGDVRSRSPRRPGRANHPCECPDGPNREQRALKGHLRVQATGRKIPFTLVLSGNTIRYEFVDKDIILRLGENRSELMEARKWKQTARKAGESSSWHGFP